MIPEFLRTAIGQPGPLQRCARLIRTQLLVTAVAAVAAGSLANVSEGQAAPLATVPLVLLYNSSRGALQPLAKADGKPMVVNLWATWCPPCRAEMPALAQAQKEHPEINVVFVNQGESPEVVQEFLAETRVHVQNLMFDDHQLLVRAVGVKAYPATLFYDALGRLVKSHYGGFSRTTFEEALRAAFPTISGG